MAEISDDRITKIKAVSNKIMALCKDEGLSPLEAVVLLETMAEVAGLAYKMALIICENPPSGGNA
jgi:hypothetical protein